CTGPAFARASPRACHEASRRARSLLQDGRQMTVARAKMRVAQWARLHTPARCGLRWGAWYPVMALTPREAQLWVRGRAVVVARSLLELRSTPSRPPNVAGRSAVWRYPAATGRTGAIRSTAGTEPRAGDIEGAGSGEQGADNPSGGSSPGLNNPRSLLPS